ncbi:hypothetical protein SDC9_63188 [bioreactor metagenome]|uniref:Uncharacterized protein n=1 Tax=bioreactor metagenome TaxID=1076179 RepID=A0A644XKT1_9ZZZZ
MDIGCARAALVKPDIAGQSFRFRHQGIGSRILFDIRIADLRQLNLTGLEQIDVRGDFFADFPVDLIQFDVFRVPISFVWNHRPVQIRAIPTFHHERSVVHSVFTVRSVGAAQLARHLVVLRQIGGRPQQILEISGRIAQSELHGLLIDRFDSQFRFVQLPIVDRFGVLQRVQFIDVRGSCCRIDDFLIGIDKIFRGHRITVRPVRIFPDLESIFQSVFADDRLFGGDTQFKRAIVTDAIKTFICVLKHHQAGVIC